MRYAFLTLLLFPNVEGMIGSHIDSVFVHMVRDKLEKDITANISNSNFKLLDEASFLDNGKAEITFSPKMECLTIDIYDCGEGVLNLKSLPDESPWSLALSIKKPERYDRVKAELTRISGNVKAALYWPSMGGGSSYVLAIGGGADSDISMQKVQHSQPLGDVVTYFLVNTMSGISE